MVDPKAPELGISIAAREFTIRQSPGILQSKREGGTTGASVWRSSIRFAEWMGSSANPLFKHDLLDTESVVLELGSGVSGLVPCMLSTNVKKIIATDQQYILKLLQDNLNSNFPKNNYRSSNIGVKKGTPTSSNIEVVALDWETDDIPNFLHSRDVKDGVDAVLACDCVFNYALISPFVQACMEICRARSSGESRPESDNKPTLCIIAQQLRQPEVFEQWLEAFTRSFHVWRVPGGMLIDSLKEGSGFVVHIGIIRTADL